MVARRAMKLSLVQDQAIAARMALIVGADNFDRLFRGVRFDEVDGDILFAYAADEYRAAEIEDNFALHISIIASSAFSNSTVCAYEAQTARATTLAATAQNLRKIAKLIPMQTLKPA
jgi:hypothetical protein